MGSLLPMILIYAVIIGLVYLFLIRPNSKRKKEEAELRNSIEIGNEIVTIGGIVGKIVKTKDETIVIQVGADKVKMEMMRWAVSSVTKEAHGKAREVYEEVKEEDEAPKKKGIKRLRKETAEEVEQAAQDPVEQFEKVEEEVKEAENNDPEGREAEDFI